MFLKFFRDTIIIEYTNELFGITNFTEFKAKRIDGEVIYNAVIQTKKQVDAAFISFTINNYPYIISLEKTESDR